MITSELKGIIVMAKMCTLSMNQMIPIAADKEITNPDILSKPGIVLISAFRLMINNVAIIESTGSI